METSSAISTRFKIWKTIIIGEHTNPRHENVHPSLEDEGYNLGKWASEVIGPCFEESAEIMEADLVKVSPADLGINNEKVRNMKRRDVMKAGYELGLLKCHSEIGPRTRLSYTEQPVNELIIIVMDTLSDCEEPPVRGVFALSNDNGKLWLHGLDPETVANADDLFVFSLPPRK